MVQHPGCWTNGQPFPGTGTFFRTTNPVNQTCYWEGFSASASDCSIAIAAANAAGFAWRNTPLNIRVEHLHAYAKTLTACQDDIATTISLETGKPLWESRTEVQAMIQKIPISITAYQERCPERHICNAPKKIHVKHHPHGVMAVLGPFNFPGHLPNGHIVPALLAGNTVVFKPSEHTPQTGLLMATLWQKSGLPDGILNLVFGGRDTGQHVAQHPLVAGICFTGSAAAGIALSRLVADTPWKILALEMGGNNPLVITDWDTIDDVADLILVSAYQTTGQRCTCARRLILTDTPDNKRLIQHLITRVHTLRIGAPNDTPEPFMGPLISTEAADRLVTRYQQLLDQGGHALVPLSHQRGSAFVTPGLVDITGQNVSDEESFGPLLLLQWAKNTEEAFVRANSTAYGLSAGLVAKDPTLFEHFTQSVRAGMYSHNCPTTGASSAAPFGGLGMSGNHRPSAYYAADYCAYPTTLGTCADVGPTSDLPGFRLCSPF